MLIKLTVDRSNREIWLNTDIITYIEVVSGVTQIKSESSTYSIMESPEEIAKIVNAKTPPPATRCNV